MPPKPLELIILEYAERRHLSPVEVDAIPFRRLKKDLDIYNLKATVIHSNRKTK